MLWSAALLTQKVLLAKKLQGFFAQPFDETLLLVGTCQRGEEVCKTLVFCISNVIIIFPKYIFQYAKACVRGKARCAGLESKENTRGCLVAVYGCVVEQTMLATLGDICAPDLLVVLR